MSDITIVASDVHHSREQAEALVRQFYALVDGIEKLEVPDDAHLKTGQLREVSKSIANLENMKIPVPDELRNLKTNLLSSVHRAEEVEQLFAFIEEETSKLVARVRRGLGPGPADSHGHRRSRRSNEDHTSRDVLRECIIKSLKSHGGAAKAPAILDEIGEMLEGKMKPGDMELTSTKQPVWRMNTCFERRAMVRDGILKEDSPTGFWEFTSRYSGSKAT
jgi:hypothetical protein